MGNFLKRFMLAFGIYAALGLILALLMKDNVFHVLIIVSTVFVLNWLVETLRIAMYAFTKNDIKNMFKIDWIVLKNIIKKKLHGNA